MTALQLFRQVLSSFKHCELTLDTAFKPIFDDPIQFHNMRFLAAIYMCLCLSTVCCEAGFSLMASIMTATRNSMNIITLDALLQIASNGPTFDHFSSSGDHEINLILEASFDHWKLTSNRFPARAHGRQGRSKKAASGSFSRFV
jgi:hypothetical protein